MPNQRLLMRQIREVLRHKYVLGLSEREIGRALGISKSGVGDAIRRARSCELTWPLPDELTDHALERRLFPSVEAAAPDRRPKPDWLYVYKELRRRDMTLALLWEEYKARAPDGYGYSRFCDHYRDWLGRQKPSMRQTHVAGDKMFVDFAGRTVDVVDALTGEVRTAQVAAPRSVRETLASYGSRYSTSAIHETPVSENVRQGPHRLPRTGLQHRYRFRAEPGKDA
ncbi:MAG: hypothetical protein HQL37_06060 [Alphaproteobacteria bacterium]|nr:hypothetical protein [Alphaproteobacteria bacterium]